MIPSNVQKLKTEQLTNLKYFLIHTTITQIITEVLTFSELNPFRKSIRESKELLKTIQTISVHLKENKLPLEPILKNILILEKFLEIKSYIRENQILFIIEFPIVENKNYAYCHL